MARSEKPQMILAELAETTTRTGHQIFAGNANGLRVLLVYHRERTNAGDDFHPAGDVYPRTKSLERLAHSGRCRAPVQSCPGPNTVSIHEREVA